MAARTADAVLSGAVDVARAAAEDAADRPADVGAHLGAETEEGRVVSHRFEALARGYRGWHWTVTLTRVPRGRTPSVSEVHLLPGDDALLAAPWVPWEERLRPGDVGPGDVLPFLPDDPRLQPGWQPSDDDPGPPIEELALARVRALGPQGREEAAQRWHLGSHGPTSPVAVASTSPCASCGFLVPLSGSLGLVFGVCANEWSPDDGKVVSLDHGCGAHSETDAEQPPSAWPEQLPEGEPLEVVETAALVEAEAPAQEEAPAEAEVPAEAEPVVERTAEAESSTEPEPQPQPQPEPEPEPEPASETEGDGPEGA